MVALAGGGGGFHLVEQGGQVEGCQLAILQQLPAADPDVADLVAARGVNDLRNGIIDRAGVDMRQVDRDDIRGLALFEAAGFLRNAERACAAIIFPRERATSVASSQTRRDRSGERCSGSSSSRSNDAHSRSGCL